MTPTQLKEIIHWKPLPYLVSLFFILTIFGIHMLPSMDSMLNENNTRISHGFLKSQIDYHQEIAPFARRPLTSFLIESAMDVFGLRPGHAFILVNFLLLFLSGPLLFKLSKTIGSTDLQALVNTCVYYMSFSVLFAFFPPVFSYDEPMQYCFLLLSLIAFVRNRWLYFVPFFTLALISRETSILLLPALLLFLPGREKFREYPFSKKHLKTGIVIGIPLLLYGIYLIFFIHFNDQFEATQIEMASRYTCFLENFESTRNTVESMTSLFLALGPFIGLLAFRKRIVKKAAHKRWVKAFLLTAIINTPIVILTSFARETRLFALPLLFLWPVFAQWFGWDFKLLAARVKVLKAEPLQVLGRWPILIGLLLVALFVNYWFCFEFYPAWGLGENTFYSEYLFLVNLLLLLIGFLRSIHGKTG